MITERHFAAALGFAFVAVWITLNFGWAILCLAGALVFYLAALVLERAAGGVSLEGIAGRFAREEPVAPPESFRPRVR